jgi:hypothetical protein
MADIESERGKAEWKKAAGGLERSEGFVHSSSSLPSFIGRFL